MAKTKIRQCIEALTDAHNPKTQTPQELEQKLDNLYNTYDLSTIETALIIITAQNNAQTHPPTHTPEWRKQGFDSWNDYDHFNHQWYKDD